MRVYLDNCTFNRPFDNQAQIKIRLETEAKLYIQSGIREKRYTLVWSYMLDFENDKNPYREKRNAILPWKRIAEFYCASSTDILSVGSEIMGKGFGAKDSLHIACAIESKCDYFITTDDKITNKKVDGIRIINPIDFVIEMENLK